MKRRLIPPIEKLRQRLAADEARARRTREKLAAHEARLQLSHRAAATRLSRQARSDALRDMRGDL